MRVALGVLATVLAFLLAIAGLVWLANELSNVDGHFTHHVATGQA